ncbi:MAG TPA: Stk1 family PASTA domain-containing Ser/Thr kinase [Erysipelotrichaceae bacterium]|nr:Stk1 family PASTA domain-containing Ser/Thr kinase [Erysipelotrichaceae bacterium]
MIEILASRYRILKRLGEGGMADVFLSQDELLNREVAIKVLRGNLSLEPVSVLRFQREANSASALTHPNIVEIYDVGEENGHHYIVMEYIRGRTLKQLIQQRGALEINEALAIMDQLISAVAEAHKNNIIHRDIKPQNVLIKDDGTVKITDFGIATVSDSLQLTQTDTVLGSVHYLAPELARGESATFQSDIYSLGICFYELLTGEVPYRGETPVQVAMKHLKDEMPSVLEFNPTLPMSIENIILKSTAKNRNNRYKSAEDMRLDLKTSLSDKNKNVKRFEFDQPNESDETIIINKVNGLKEEKVGKWNIKSFWGMGLVLFSTITLIFILALSGVFDPNRNMVEVPDLTNMTLAEAREALFDSGIEIASTINYELTDNVEAGKVIKITPSIGTLLEKGSTINITLSEGIYFVVEDYNGRNIDEVKKELEDTKINVRIEYLAKQDIPSGLILEQELLLPDTKLDPKRQYEIKFIVSAPVEFLIPQIKGLNIATAQAQLEALGAVVYLNQLSTEGMSEEQISKLTRDVVVDITPEPLEYYTQGPNNFIELSYY